MVTKGEELGGRINGEFGIDIYTILHLSGGSVTTKRGGMGWEGGPSGRGHMYSDGRLMWIYSRNQHKVVKQLSFN